MPPPPPHSAYGSLVEETSRLLVIYPVWEGGQCPFPRLSGGRKVESSRWFNLFGGVTARVTFSAVTSLVGWQLGYLVHEKSVLPVPKGLFLEQTEGENRGGPPCVVPGYPLSCLFPSLVHSLPHLLLFSFSFSHLLYLFSSFVHPFPLYQNSHHSVSRPNLGLVCCIHFVLSVLLS